MRALYAQTRHGSTARLGVTSPVELFEMIRGMFKDLRFSIRALIRQPLYSTVAIVTLALGIGATTAIFSIVKAVLLEPLPYAEPDRLYALRSRDANGLPTGLMAPRFAQPFYEGHPLVEAGTLTWATAGSILSSDGSAYPLTPVRVTDRFFNVFTDAIAMGRTFAPKEPPTSIVISHSVWQKYFGSNPNIVGSVITVDNTQRTVVGVARPGFSFPIGAETWQVVDPAPNLTDRINFYAFLRLRPNVTAKSLEAELAVLSTQLGPNTETGKAFVYALRPLLDEIVGDLDSTVRVLSGAAVVLLLIACVNVVNLLLSRANTRSHEIGLREALGAARFRIVRQLMTESLVLCTIGGMLGLLFGYSGVRLLLGIGPANLPRLESVHLDGTVLLFSVGTICFATLFVGLAPALKLSLPQLRQVVDAGARGGSMGRGENRVFTALVVAEIGLAVMLFSGSGLLLHSYINLARTDPGVDSRQILWMRLNATHLPIGSSGYQPIVDFYHQLMDRIRTVPGVAEVTNTQVLPLVRNAVEATPEPFAIRGRADKGETVRIRPVATNFFSTMGVRIVAGRDLQPTDQRGALGVALVNEAFVRRYFVGENPLGQRLLLSMSRDFQPMGRSYGFGERLSDGVEIVGVVPDIRFVSMSESALPNVYMSADQFTSKLRVLAVRTRLDSPASIIPTIRREVAALAPTVPVEFGVYTDSIHASIARQRLGTALLAVFGTMALVLAAVGVYGTMAYSVTHRTREIAVRAALGASTGDVLGLVMKRGALMAFSGVFLGIVGTVAVRTIIQSQLYEVSAMDPAVLIFVPLVLLVIALVASFLPARRASRIDPAVMLRARV